MVLRDTLYGQRASEGKGNYATKVAQSACTSRDNVEKELTESEEGEGGDDEGRVLHVECRNLTEGRKSSGLETELVGNLVCGDCRSFKVCKNAGDW